MAGADQLLNILITATAGQALREFVSLNRELESTRLALEAVLGGEEQSAAAFAHLANTADKAGLSLMTLSKQFVNLAAASQGTVLEGQATADLFDAVAGTMGKLGKSTAETERVFAALGQMMAKGQIFAEEWRGQLSESLPLANAAIQKATGLTTKEFNRMMEAGELLSADVLPALTKGLNELGVTGAEQVDSLSASMTRLENATTQLFGTLGQDGVNERFQEIMDGATLAVKALTVGNHELLEILGDVGKATGEAIPGWSDLSFYIDKAKQAIADYIEGQHQLLTTQEATSEAAEAASKAMQDDAAAALRSKSAYAGLIETLKQTTDAIKKKGEATIAAADASLELARISGNEIEVLKAQASAAEASEQAIRNNASAKAAEAAAIEQNIAKLKAQLATSQEMSRTQGVETQEVANAIKAKEDKIVTEQKALDLARAATETLTAQADQQAFATEQARLNAATVGDQSAAYAGLVQKLEAARATMASIATAQREAQLASSQLAGVQAVLAQTTQDLANANAVAHTANAPLTASIEALTQRQQAAKIRVEELTAAIALGAQADQQAEGAKLALAIATAKAADAARDLAERRTLELETAERLTTALAQEGALRITHLRNLAREADARGEVLLAAQYERDALEAEIASLERLVAAKDKEIAAEKAVLSAKLAVANADAEISLQEQAAIDRAKESVATKEREKAAIEETLRDKEAEAAITRDVADAYQEAGQAADEAGKKTQSYGDSIKPFEERMKSGASAAVSWAESLARAAQWTGVATDAFGEYSREAEDAYATAVRGNQAVRDTLNDIALSGKSLGGAMNATGDAFRRLAKEEVEAAVQAANLARAYDAMQSQVSTLQDQFDRGDLGLSAYASRLQGLISANHALGQEKLQPLRDALREAKAQMQEFTESSRDGLRQLQIEWAQLNNRQADVENLEYQKDRIDLEAQIAEAQRNGNAAALAALQQQLALLAQIHAKKLADLKTEAAASKQTGAGGTSAATSTASPATGMTSTATAAPASTAAPAGAFNTTINIAGVLDVNDRVTLASLGRKLQPVLSDLQRRGA